MEIKILTGGWERVQPDMLVVTCSEPAAPDAPGTLQRHDGGLALDRQLGGFLQAQIAREAFHGDLGKCRIIPLPDGAPAKYVTIVGSGRGARQTVDIWRRIGIAVAQAAQSVKAAQVALMIGAETVGGVTATLRAQALIEGIYFGRYQFVDFRTQPTPPPLTTISFLTTRQRAALEKAAQRGRDYAEAACWARDLVNTPSNVCIPQYLAQQAQQLARRERGVQCTILNRKQIEAARMHLVMAVNQGSQFPPVFIHLRYRPRGKAKRYVALVGKGITFDTGGHNLKSGRSMTGMKDDMAGAAAAMAIMQIIARHRPALRVEAFIPVTENVIGGGSFKPDDVFTSRAGKTVEIINTDAEGRLVLADAIDYAADTKPDLILDMATLTGSVKYALGELYTAALGTARDQIARLIRAGTVTGEPIWELPVVPEYLEGFKGGPADLRNIGTSAASTITGAVFLAEFVRDIPWIHLDIAESSWADEARPGYPKGATGSPVRAVAEFLLNL